MLFIANPAAAGGGNTLHRARISIFESFSNQTAHYLKSLDRIHKKGQNREVEYYILLCDGTIELAEYDKLLVKERTGQNLLGDSLPILKTRQSMLDKLILFLKSVKDKIDGNKLYED